MKYILKAKIKNYENNLNGFLKEEDVIDEVRQPELEKFCEHYQLLNAFVIPVGKKLDWEKRGKKKREALCMSRRRYLYRMI